MGEDKDREGDWKVEMRTVFRDFGGGQVDRQALGRKSEVGTTQSAANAVTGLGNGFTGEANEVKRGEAFGEVTFDVDELSGVTERNE